MIYMYTLGNIYEEKINKSGKGASSNRSAQEDSEQAPNGVSKDIR